MHGLIVNQLRQYVLLTHGPGIWQNMIDAAGGSLGEGPPNVDRIYPDSLTTALIGKASELVGLSVPTVLEDFGQFLAPVLLRVYKPLILPEWRTLDVIEHTEEYIHTVVRLRDPKAGPPYLAATRVSPAEVQIVYTSPRRMCFFGEGISRGIAKQFDERVEISQPECMHYGGSRCLISVRLPS